MMTRQSMARVSSASTEADFAPAMIPFDWEAAPGRSARKSIKSGFSGNIAAAGRGPVEVPALPLPPGRRPKDGFNASYSRPSESPVLQSEVQHESSGTPSQPRKLFNLNFPGSSTKPSSTSRMRLPFLSSSKPPKVQDSHVDEDHSFSIFNPISGHRFGSSITRRMLEQFHKKQSLWRRCLPSKPETEDQRKASSSHMDLNKGRRLDSVDEGFVTAADSPVSGPSLPSSPGHGYRHSSNSTPVVTKQLQPSSPSHGHRHSSNSTPVVTKQLLQPSSPGHGHRHSSNSSPVVTKQLLQPSSPGHGHRHSSNSSPVVTKQLQVTSSRFMASMLISLCPEADDSDESQFDAVDGFTGDYNDEISTSHLTTPRAKSSSPEAIFETPAKPSECFEIVVDPASQTVTSHEECRCTCKHRARISAKVDLPAPQVSQRKKMSRSVSRSLHEELATARSPSEHFRSGNLVQHEDSANKFNQNTVAHRKDNADAYPMFSKASSNREGRRRESYNSSFSWKSYTEKSRPNQEPAADLEALDIAQEPGDSEIAKEIFEDVGEKYERRGANRSLARNFSTGSNSSSSSESNSRHNTVWPRPNSLSPSISKDVDVPASKSKYGAPLSMVGYLSPPRTSCGDSEYTSNREKPKAFARWRSTVEPSFLRKSSLEGGSEQKRPPATRSTLNSLSPPRKQALQQRTTPSKIRIKDRKTTLKSSSRRPTPSKPLDSLRNDDTDDSDEDSECSTDLSAYNTPRAVSSPNFASPKPASPVLPESLLNSPSLLKFKLQRQQSQREPLPLPYMVDQETALPGPSFKQVLMARSHSVRRSSSRVFTPQECYAISADTNFRGPDPAPASRLAKTSSSSVMSKVAEWEMKAGVGSSGKSAPLYRFERTMSTSSTTTYKPAAR